MDFFEVNLAIVETLSQICATFKPTCCLLDQLVEFELMLLSHGIQDMQVTEDGIRIIAIDQNANRFIDNLSRVKVLGSKPWLGLGHRCLSAY